jgi:hypothetical protein
MRCKSIGALPLVALIALCAHFCLAAPSVDDANIILELKQYEIVSSLNFSALKNDCTYLTILFERAWNATYFPDWNAGNITNLCFWTGISCDGEERVAALYETSRLARHFFLPIRASLCIFPLADTVVGYRN